MDFVKLFQSLEDAVFEIVTWIVLLPKTFLHAVFKPNWIHQYVTSEWKKEPEHRFDDYLSPVIFWVLAGVLPLTYIYINAGELGKQGAATALDPTHLYNNAFFALIAPIIYLAWIETLNKRPLKKSTLKRQFFIQCYVFAATQFIFALGYGWLGFFPNNLLSKLAAFSEPLAQIVSFYIPTLFVAAAALFLTLTETLVFRAELKLSLLRACVLALAPFLMLFILGVLIALIVTV